jgi:hypothetical protein
MAPTREGPRKAVVVVVVWRGEDVRWVSEAEEE